jgi:HK97 family phage prohead protease
MNDRDEFHTYLRQLKLYEEAERFERRRLAGELVKRRLVPSSVSRDPDPLASAVSYLVLRGGWEQQMADLKRSYPGAGPKLLAETMALFVITEHDHEAAERSFRLREAERKAKQSAQTTKAKPAGRIIRKEFHQRTIPVPQPGETRTEFETRCIEELVEDGEDQDAAEQACELAWARRRATAVSKAADAGIPFVISTEDVDRAGDVIIQRGWRLESFKANAPCLFAHLNDFVVGRWSAVHVAGKALLGTLHLAPEGISDRVTEVVRLVAHGLLRSVSVGFHCLRSSPRRSADGAIVGTTFEEQDLIEVSLTPTPCNPHALAVARSLGVSRDTMNLVFRQGGRR